MGDHLCAVDRALANRAAGDNRRYEEMAEGLVREVLELRRTGFPPEYQWSRVFVPLIWGLAPRWRDTLVGSWRRLNGNTNLLRALFDAADTMGIAEPRDLARTHLHR